MPTGSPAAAPAFVIHGQNRRHTTPADQSPEILPKSHQKLPFAAQSRPFFVNPDTPFPRTLTALRRLNSRQLEFCHRLTHGDYGTAAYQAAYGSSRCPRKAAAKIKAGRAVREYLEARYEELCIRDRIAREISMQEITERRTGFNALARFAARLEDARREQATR